MISLKTYHKHFLVFNILLIDLSRLLKKGSNLTINQYKRYFFGWHIKLEDLVKTNETKNSK